MRTFDNRTAVGYISTESLAYYGDLVPKLEQMELESSFSGHASFQVYGQLLALYLLLDDLDEARLLWKRIPEEVKETNVELQQVWLVGRALVERNLSVIYSLVDDFEWPNHLNNIMNGIKEHSRTRVVHLIGKLYRTIHLDQVVHALGQSKEETLERLHKLGWRVNEKDEMVEPIDAPLIQTGKPSSSFEEVIAKLTELVSFIEK